MCDIRIEVGGGAGFAVELKRAEDILTGLDPEESIQTDFGASEEQGDTVR